MRYTKELRYNVDENGCWNWIGATTKGYGHLGINGKFYLAHRLMWEQVNGKIPEGLWVLHKCDNRKCINPDHLFLGTNQDNVDDRENKKRGNHIARGEKNGRAKLKDKDVGAIRKLSKMNMPTKMIAAFYEISQRQVQYIVAKKSWRPLPASPESEG